MQGEPLLSLPIELVALILLGVIGLSIAAGLLAFRIITKRGHPSAVSWLQGIIDALPFGVLIVVDAEQALTYNATAQHHLRLSGHRIPRPLSAVATRVAKSGMPETAHLPGVEGKGHLRFESLPLQVSGVNQGVLFLLREVEESEGHYRQLLGALSHELRTPLTGIMGHLDILRTSGPEEEKLRQRSQQFIGKEVARLARLVEDLLQLSRLESTPVDLQPVNPRVVAEEAISSSYQRAEAQGVALLLRADSNLPRVQADPDRLQQVLINLLDNAIKASPPGSSAVVTLRPEANGVRVVVSDNGPGIPPQDLPYLFDPFFRGASPDRAQTQGTGLGLTIVKSILDQHGAAMWIDSTPGRGTHISFKLRAVPGGR